MIKTISSYLQLRSLYILSLDAAGDLVANPLHYLGTAPLLPYPLSQLVHSRTECTMRNEWNRDIKHLSWGWGIYLTRGLLVYAFSFIYVANRGEGGSGRWRQFFHKGGYEANALSMIKNISSYLWLRSLYILSLDVAGDLVAASLHSLGTAPSLPCPFWTIWTLPDRVYNDKSIFSGFYYLNRGRGTLVVRRDRDFFFGSYINGYWEINTLKNTKGPSF